MVRRIVERALRLAGLPDEARARQILEENASLIYEKYQLEIAEEQENLYIYALACFTLASALPALHTFYINDAPRLAKQYAETDMVFLSPEEVSEAVKHYRQLGEEAISKLRGGDFNVEAIP